MNKSSIQMLVLAVILIVAVFMANLGDDPVIRATEGASTEPVRPVIEEQAGGPVEATQENPPVDMFAVRTWQPPPPPSQIPVLPPPPQAPPLPFKFLGRIVEDGRGEVFLLTAGYATLSVAVGDVVDNHYLVEKIEAGQIHFLYRPLNMRQTLYIGPAT